MKERRRYKEKFDQYIHWIVISLLRFEDLDFEYLDLDLEDELDSELSCFFSFLVNFPQSCIAIIIEKTESSSPATSVATAMTTISSTITANEILAILLYDLSLPHLLRHILCHPEWSSMSSSSSLLFRKKMCGYLIEFSSYRGIYAQPIFESFLYHLIKPHTPCITKSVSNDGCSFTASLDLPPHRCCGELWSLGYSKLLALTRICLTLSGQEIQELIQRYWKSGNKCALVTATKLLQLAVESNHGLSQHLILAILGRITTTSTIRDDGTTSFMDKLISIVLKFYQRMYFDFPVSLSAIASKTMITALGDILLIGMPTTKHMEKVAALMFSSSIISASLCKHINYPTRRTYFSGLHNVFIMGCIAHNGYISADLCLNFLRQISRNVNWSEHKRVLFTYYVICHRYSQLTLINQGRAFITDFRSRTMDHLEMIPTSLWVCFQHLCQEKSFEDISANLIGSKLLEAPNWNKIIPFANLQQKFKSASIEFHASYIPSVLDPYDTWTKQRLKLEHAASMVVAVPDDKKFSSAQNQAFSMDEILENILRFVSFKRLCRLSLVSQIFYEVANFHESWRRLYHIRWPKIICHHGNLHLHDWKSMFKIRFLVLKRIKRRKKDCTSILCNYCNCTNLSRNLSQKLTHIRSHRLHRNSPNQ